MPRTGGGERERRGYVYERCAGRRKRTLQSSSETLLSFFLSFSLSLSPSLSFCEDSLTSHLLRSVILARTKRSIESIVCRTVTAQPRKAEREREKENGRIRHPRLHRKYRRGNFRRSGKDFDTSRGMLPRECDRRYFRDEYFDASADITFDKTRLPS